MVEFAVAFGMLLSVFAGVFQFGYTFYQYNMLESAVRDGARYGSLAQFDGGSWGGANFTTRVRQMVMYGNPNASSGTRVVPNLTPANITVTPTYNGIVPTRITVQIDDFAINAFFTTFTLNSKPRVTFDYMGQFTVP